MGLFGFVLNILFISFDIVAFCWMVRQSSFVGLPFEKKTQVVAFCIAVITAGIKTFDDPEINYNPSVSHIEISASGVF